MTKNKKRKSVHQNGGASPKNRNFNDSVSSVCPKCDKQFKTDDEVEDDEEEEWSIGCDGICGRWFHVGCVTLTKAEYRVITSKTHECNLKWFCTECNDGFNKKLNGTATDKSKTPEIMFLLEENKRLNSEIQTLLKEKTEKTHDIPTSIHLNTQPTKLSYSKVCSTTRSPTEPKPTPKNNILVVKPTKDEDKNMVLNMLKQTVKPTELKANIIRCEQKDSGTVVIHCQDENSCNTLRENIRLEMNETVEVFNATKKKARFEFAVHHMGRESELPESMEEIANILITQNALQTHIKDCFLKVLKIRKLQNMDIVILEVDKETKNFIHQRDNKLGFGWIIATLYEHVHVLYCYHCQGYGHTQKDCKNGINCGYCGYQHDSRECDSDDRYCINCHNHNEQFKTNFNCHHKAHDYKKCKIFSDIKNKVKKRYE
ncbi:hypothetical protein B566_EDAN016425 [Ephemera danica]|nr:hypothetical protein B566_EDAN016425 [Ephemera danica]